MLGAEPCAEGQVDDGGVCVPEACGTGTWGAKGGDADAVHVDTTASGTPDGSAESPFPAIQEAVDLAAERGGGTVVVAAGTYPAVTFGSDHRGVSLEGRCADLVVIDGGDAGEDPAILVERNGSRSPDVALADLTVRGGYIGLLVGAGVVEGAGLRLLDNRLVGLYAYGGSDVTMRDLGIRGARTDARTAGRGVEVEGATLTVEGCTVEDSDETGIFVNGSGSLVTLRDCAVTAAEGNRARGADVGGQGTLEVYDSVFSGSTEFGLFATAAGTTVRLVDTVVEGTTPNAAGEYGRGLNITDGAELVVEGGELAENTEVGLYVAGPGAHASLDGTSIRDTQPGPTGYYGRGVAALDGARIDLTDVTLVGNHESSVEASDIGSTVEMTGGAIQSTLAGPEWSGRGLSAIYGALLVASEVEIDASADVGVFAAAEGVVELDGVTIRGTLATPRDVADGGVVAVQGGMVQATGCWIEANHGVGFLSDGEGSVVEVVDSDVVGPIPRSEGEPAPGVWAVRGGFVRLADSRVTGANQVGVAAYHAGAVVELLDTVVSGTLSSADGAGGRGVDVSEGGSLWMDGGAVDDAGECGIAVYGEGSSAILTGVAVRDTRRDALTSLGAGVVASGVGTSVVAEDLEVTDTEGTGLYGSDGASLACTGCRIERAAFAGVLVAGADATLIESTVDDTRSDANEGGGVGLFVAAGFGPTTVLLSDSTIGPHPYAAVWIDGDVTAVLDGNTLSGGDGVELGATRVHGNAVYAWNGTSRWDEASATGLLLAGNRLEVGVGVPVLLHGAEATLEGNSWPGSSEDLRQQQCVGVDPLVGGELDGAAADVCPGRDLLVNTALRFEGLYFGEALSDG